MLGFLAKRVLKGAAFKPLRFYFSGGAHHEIDYYAVVTKNKKSCTYLAIKNTILTLMKSVEELQGS